MVCPNCRGNNDDESKYCEHCGANIAEVQEHLVQEGYTEPAVKSGSPNTNDLIDMNIFCQNCGKQIPKDSKFCQFCGDALASDDSLKKEKVKLKRRGVWEIFTDIYDFDEEKRKKYNDLSSNEAWELINRLGKNSFESFIEDNKEILNKQPYKVIEKLESTYKLCVIGGYWLWMAEYISKNGESWKLRTIQLDDLVKEWTSALEKQGDFVKTIPEDLSEAISKFQNFQVNSILEECPSIKELSTEFIEKVKFDLLLKILWGYFIGTSESKYIK